MNEFAEYIKEIDIDQLWSGQTHIHWKLDRSVNVLSGVNGVGKSTILNRVIRKISGQEAYVEKFGKGVRIDTFPEDAKKIRYDIIRSIDRPLLSSDALGKLDHSLMTELDWQLFLLQRRYLDYQVNMGNRIIQALQSPESRGWSIRGNWKETDSHGERDLFLFDGRDNTYSSTFKRREADTLYIAHCSCPRYAAIRVVYGRA